MRILLIGGTLFIGKRLVRRLLNEGHEITLLHRRAEHPFGPEVRSAVADRNDARSVRDALQNQRFDAVYDLAYDWERGTTGEQVEATVKAIPGDISRYVFISSVAAYGSGLDHLEDDPLAPDTHPDSYVRNKSMSERALFRMHRESGFPVVTMRPPFVYGPDNPFYREAFFWDRIRRDRPVIVPGDGKRLMHFVYVDDLVAACCAALKNPNAVGLAFNVANEKPVSQLELINEFAKAAGKKVSVVHVPREIIERNGGNVFQEPLYFAQYYDVHSITEIVNRLKNVLHIEPTAFADGLRETFRWYANQPEKQTIDFRFEDKLIREAEAT
ncbi:MAG TPA: NAD-dependent epimerase/dehydratase family protein [Terriglobales bacterium]|nr:NAD-dependent epimerase/dehydratase family protein [Terriglobales bacterium]